MIGPLSPLASWALVAIVVGLPALSLYCAMVTTKRAESQATPLHTHTCTRCGRIQHWTEPFDQWSPCRACQIWKPESVIAQPVERIERRPYDEQVRGYRVRDARDLDIDLEHFADADAIRVYLGGADVIRDAHS